MSHLQRMAEEEKLARQLGVPANQLDVLENLDETDLRRLREDVANVMFSQAKAHTSRVAAATKMVPNALCAKLAEKVFGAKLAARIVGMLDADTALDIALRLSDNFLAEAASQLDPASASALIRKFPVARIKPVTTLMVGQGDYVTMARFVDHIDPQVIGEVIPEIGSDEALLRTAFLVESKEILNDLVRFIPDDRLKRIAAFAGTGDHDLWAEALSLTTAMDDHGKGRIGDLVAEHGDELSTSMLESAQRLNLWDAVLPVVACMSPSSRERLVKLPALAQPAVLQAVVAAANDNGLWDRFLPLVEHMDDNLRGTAIDIIEGLPADVLLGIFAAASEHDLWKELLSIVADMAPEQRRRAGDLIAERDQTVLGELLALAQAKGLWGDLLPFVGDMSEKSQAAVMGLPQLSDPDVLEGIIAAANAHQLWADVLPLVAHMNDRLRATTVGLIEALPAATRKTLAETLNQISEVQTLVVPEEIRDLLLVP